MGRLEMSVAEVRVDGEGRGEGVGEQEGLGPWEEWGLCQGYGRAFLGRGTELHQGFRKTFGCMWRVCCGWEWWPGQELLKEVWADLEVDEGVEGEEEESRELVGC